MAGQKALLGLAILSVMKNRNKTVAGNEFKADNRQPLAPVSSSELCTPETLSSSQTPCHTRRCHKGNHTGQGGRWYCHSDQG